MDKVFNLRDLGGIVTKNNRVVKKGMIYRSATLNEASESDIEYLKSLNLKSIIDFRDPTEFGDNSIYSCITEDYANLPINLDSTRICNLQNNRTLKNALIPLDKEDMRIAYRKIPFANSSYYHLINCLRNNKAPLLFHCTAGKDRTGVASAIILSLLGVDKEEIVKDYLITKKIETYISDYVTKNINWLVRKKITKCMKPLFLADESYILAALDEIEAKYNSYEDYFMQEYGIDSKEQENIRLAYSIDS